VRIQMSPAAYCGTYMLTKRQCGPRASEASIVTQVDRNSRAHLALRRTLPTDNYGWTDICHRLGCIDPLQALSLRQIARVYHNITTRFETISSRIEQHAEVGGVVPLYVVPAFRPQRES
jgi:hypothetical protein